MLYRPADQFCFFMLFMERMKCMKSTPHQYMVLWAPLAFTVALFCQLSLQPGM